MRAAAASRIAARSYTLRRDHAGNAAAAASSACRASAAPPNGTSSTTSSVAGSTSGTRRPSAASTQRPPTSITPPERGPYRTREGSDPHVLVHVPLVEVLHRVVGRRVGVRRGHG